MRILFTSHYALPHHGGIEVVIDALARALVARGHEVVHLASDVQHDASFSRPYRVVPVPSSNLPEERAGVPVPLFHPALIGALRSELKKADVLHAHGFLYPSSAAAMLWARTFLPRGPARVLTEHVGHVHYESSLVNSVESAAIASLGRVVARCAEAVVVFNERVERELHVLAPHAQFHWMENGVDLSRFRPPTPEEKASIRQELGWDARPRVLFVGRLVAKKGVDLALATAAAAGAAFEMVLVGPGELSAVLPPNARLLGAQPAEQVARLYRAADAFLLPSRGEGFPLTVQEAMASGLPAFVLDDPGYARYTDAPLLHRTSADPQEIASRIAGVLRNPPPIGGARTGDWSEVARKHEELYASILRHRARAS